MPSEPKKRYPNSGILSRNDRAAGNPNAAPYAGQLDIDCPHCQAQVQMWINAWVKDGARGKFFSMRFKDKNAADFVGNYAVANSSLKAMQLSVDLLWSAKKDVLFIVLAGTMTIDRPRAVRATWAGRTVTRYGCGTLRPRHWASKAHRAIAKVPTSAMARHSSACLSGRCTMRTCHSTAKGSAAYSSRCGSTTN
jgi:hypothetical protein